jgi:hypothetical protein
MVYKNRVLFEQKKQNYEINVFFMENKTDYAASLKNVVIFLLPKHIK